MALQISENNGIFYLNGNLNTATLKSFTNYFNYNLYKLNREVLVNIDKLVEIDKSGLEAIRELTKVAILKQTVFSIVGFGCKEIYDDFNQINLA